MSKFFHNRATTRICANKPFIVIECKILTTHKKSKQTSLLLVRNTPRFILWFERENLSQLTDNCEQKAQNLGRKWRKSKSKNSRITKKYFTSQRPEVIKTNLRNVQLASFSALFLLLVGSGPKWSMPIEKLGSSSLVSSIFQREGKLHCSFTGRKI